MLQRVYTRVSKGVARYSDRGSAAEHCSACRFFMSGGDCARVLGRVMPQGWCKYFSQEAVQRWNPLWQMTGIPAPPGATLDLSFLTSGALDPRITFTRASTATYTNYAGVMQTAAINAPRWDYNPGTLALQGLLIEEQRINVALYSSGFTLGAWSFVAVTPTIGQAGAPDGSATFTRIIETTAGGAHYMGQALAGLTASGTYTFSVYARAQEDRYLQVSFHDGSSNGAYATFDLQTGVISGPITADNTGVPVAAKMQAVGNGIYRCSVTTTITASTTGTAYLFLSNTAAPTWAPGYVGNASNGLLIFGAQLEQGAFPTSYIPTAGAAVTRAADNATMPTTGWFNPPAGTVQTEFIFVNNPPAGVQAGILRIDDGSDSNIAEFIVPPSSSAINLYGGVAGVGQISLSIANASGVPQKAAIAYGAPLWTGATGGTVTAGTGGATPLPVNRVMFGMGHVSQAWFMNGWLRRMRYWPRMLTNAEMQSVTT